MVMGKEPSRVQVKSIGIFRKSSHVQSHCGIDGGWKVMKDKAWEYYYKIFVLERLFWNGKRQEDYLREECSHMDEK